MLFKIVSEHKHLNISEENEKDMSFWFRQTWVWMAALALSNLHLCVKLLQSFSTLCNPVDCSWPGSFVQGILQVRLLECIAISFSKGSSGPRDQTHFS